MTLSDIVTQTPDLLTALGTCFSGLALFINSVRREGDKKPVK
jgi:hypothetical protein